MLRNHCCSTRFFRSDIRIVFRLQRCSIELQFNTHVMVTYSAMSKYIPIIIYIGTAEENFLVIIIFKNCNIAILKYL